MNNTPDRCSQLRKLHEQLTNQVRQLRENIEQAEREGVGAPVDMLNTVKTLQSSLRRVSQQLEGCPPETSENTALPSAALQQQAKVLQSTRWFPDSAQQDESLFDDPLGSIE
jgi:hypothetical protein